MELQFKGYTIFIDEEDYHYLEEIRFSVQKQGNTYYLNNSRKIILLHRLITNCPKDKDIDHINGNGLDNRKCNLRICTHSENHQNRNKISTKSTSKYKGVYWYKSTSKWRALIQINGKQKSLGYFEREIEAAKAYNFAALRYFKDYARINEFN